MSEQTRKEVKMRSKVLFLTLIISAASLTACIAVGGRALNTVAGSGNVITENREVSGFTAVSLQGMGEVIIDQTGSESLSITADDNIMPYLETVVNGDTLIIRTTEEVVFTDTDALTFHVTATALDAIELAGAGSFIVNDLDTEKWEVNLPGAGSITVSGHTTEQTVTMDGAGSYFAADLESEEAVIESSGAGTAVVQVSDTLDVTINGLGSVEYIGSPTVTQEINGVGKISQRP